MVCSVHVRSVLLIDNYECVNESLIHLWRELILAFDATDGLQSKQLNTINSTSTNTFSITETVFQSKLTVQHNYTVNAKIELTFSPLLFNINQKKGNYYIKKMQTF